MFYSYLIKIYLYKIQILKIFSKIYKIKISSKQFNIYNSELNVFSIKISSNKLRSYLFNMHCLLQKYTNFEKKIQNFKKN